MRFPNLAVFVRFRRLWLCSSAPDRARISRVFPSKNQKKALFLTRKTEDEQPFETEIAPDVRFPRNPCARPVPRSGSDGTKGDAVLAQGSQETRPKTQR